MTSFIQQSSRWLSPIVILVFVIIFVSWCLFTCANSVEIPHKTKLADCTNDITETSVKMPKGFGYYLELALPDTNRMHNLKSPVSCKFSGRIEISTGTSLIADLPFDSTHSPFLSSGYVLTGGNVQNTNSPPLGRFIQAQQEYNIKFIFDAPRPVSATIWLHWLQSYRDRDK